MPELWRLAPRRVAAFDAGAVAYDTYRPRYPSALFDDLDDFVERPAARVIEVGSGTGIATEPLLERGYRVTAVEPALGMAAIARAKFGAAIEHWTGRFEDFGSASPVEMVASFNAWHWVEPSVGLDRAAGLLEAGGTLALVWTEVIRYGEEPFERRLAEVLGWRPVKVFERVTACLEGLARDGRFLGPVTRHHRFERILDAERYLQVSRTYGASLGERHDATIAAVIDNDFGGSVTKVEDAVLYLYRRAPLTT